MKVQCKLQGTFHRIQLNGTDSIPVSLVDLIREVQAVATQNRRRTPQLLRQSFGLDFLPEPVLINLLQQAQGVVKESELYQVPSLQLLHIKSNLKALVANTYRYEFICCQAIFNLTPDDSQLPFFNGSDSEKSGIYTVTLEQPNYPGFSDDFAKNIWQQSINSWQTLPETHQIHIALQSLDINTFRLTIPQHPSLQIWISLQDLSLDLRAAITFLRLGEGDTSTLSEPAKLLVQQYQSTYSLPIIKLPQELNPKQIPPAQRLLIQRKNRSILEEIISTAHKFLLISSYIIEDEDLTQLICQKSQELPQGVWILTDLRNEVIDNIDVQISDNVSSRQDYQRSDERKKACLRMLLDANIPIRSGAFHLKTYISEQYAYLGSCNLTGGSLNFNVEAGIVARNNFIHTQLIKLFQQFWQQRSRDEVIPALDCDGFHLRSINRFYQQEFHSYPNLLTPSQYKRDLIEQLRNFRGKVQIYSRSFQPTPEIEQYLRLLDTQIFVYSQMQKQSSFNVRNINNLHAKITLLGDKVAYIGGINFNFSSSALSLNDLMYKTTISREIAQIYQKISSLHS